MLYEGQDVVEIPVGTDYKADAIRNFWSNAKWRTLHCLIENKANLPISEMSKMVGLSVSDVVTALESLELCGLVKKSEAGYVQTQQSIQRFRSDLGHHVDIISDYLLSSSQINNRMLETISDESHITRSVIYNSNRELVDELYAKIDQAITEFKNKSDQARDEWDGVYAMQLALIEMSKGKLS